MKDNVFLMTMSTKKYEIIAIYWKRFVEYADIIQLLSKLVLTIIRKYKNTIERINDAMFLI